MGTLTAYIYICLFGDNFGIFLTYVNTLLTFHFMLFARPMEVVKEREIYGQSDQTGVGGFPSLTK